MSIITDLTRMWLTRSMQPFVFRNEFDQNLPFADCEGLGLYVHIPFCKQICSFCPYCKQVYREETCSRYLDALIREIHMVGGQLREKKQVTSLYFGGGTPALAAGRLGEVIAALEEYFVITQGVGVELHPDNVTVPVLQTLRDAVYEMTLKGAFYYHYYENFYTLAYIDKMWGLLRKEAFPERMEL